MTGNDPYWAQRYDPPAEPGIEVDPVLVAQRVSELEETLERVAKTLGEHDEALETVLEMLTATPGGPWHFGRVDADRLRALWLELGEWVAWLEERYLVNLPAAEYALPKCWWRHPVAVELLTALMVAHLATYTRTAAMPSLQLVDWHTRALDPVFALLRTSKTFSKCDSEHAEPTRKAAHDPVAFAAWVDKVAPEPTGIGDSL